MKIAIFSDNFYPELSGVSDSIITTTRELVRMGHEIAIYVPRYSSKNFRIGNLPEGELDLGNAVKIHRFASIAFAGAGSTGQSSVVIPTGLRWMEVKKFNPDVIHTNFFYGAGIEAVIAAKILKKPLVGTNHTALGEFLRHGPIKAGWFKSSLLHYQAWYYNRCDYVTAPSQSAFTEMMENGFVKPHQVLSNPIDPVFKPVTTQVRSALKKKFGLSKNTIFYVGRLGPEKEIDVIIRAIAIAREKVPDVCLAIAGHGSEEEKLKRLTADLNLNDNVKFFGTLYGATLNELYDACDIFTIMSTSETQGMTLLQAMACGLPVVGARALSLPEYINDQNGFLIERGDHATLAERIIFLLKDSGLRKSLGEGGLDYSERFSADHIADEWEKIYRQAMERKRRI